jgi:hypothetical protein
MFGWIKKYWLGLTGAAVLNGGHIWQGIRWLWDWAGRFDIVHSHMHDLKQVSGMIGFLANPPPWTVFPSMLIGAAIILWDIRRHRSGYRSLNLGGHMSIPLIGMVVCGIGLLGFCGWYLLKPAIAVGDTQTAQPSELLRRAEADFMHSGGIATEEEKINFLPRSIEEVTVKIWIRSDLVSMGKFLVIYIPRTVDMPKMPSPYGDMRLTYEICQKLGDKFQEFIKRADAKGSAGLGDMGTDNMRYSTEAVFTGAIYIYYEGNLTEAERVDLRSFYKQRGASVYFRDYRYIRESRPPEPVSH